MSLLTRSEKGTMLICSTSPDDNLLNTRTPKPLPVATEKERHGQKRQLGKITAFIAPCPEHVLTFSWAPHAPPTRLGFGAFLLCMLVAQGLERG